MAAPYRNRVDQLIDQFWKNGYLTLSRKFGTYLPAPQPVGKYEVDAVGKYKQKIAIGIVLTEDELNSSSINSKINFLASRTTKYSHKRVTLFLGVPAKYLDKAKLMVSSLPEEIKKNIRTVPLR